MSRRIVIAAVLGFALAPVVAAAPPALGQLPDPGSSQSGADAVRSPVLPLPPGRVASPQGPAANPLSANIPPPIRDLDGPTVGAPAAYWGEFEWLLWATTGEHLPPLATVTPSAAGSAGVAIGDTRLGGGDRSGFRTRAGLWLSDHQTIGIEAEFYFVGQVSHDLAAGPSSTDTITRPFVNATTGSPGAFVVSAPGVASGSVTGTLTSFVYGAGIHGLLNLDSSTNGRVDLIIGYRFLDLTDQLTLNTSSVGLTNQPGLPAGSRLQIADQGRTENVFQGARFGLAGEQQLGMWSISGRGSLALGFTSQATRLEGDRLLTNPGGGEVALPGGFLSPAPATQPPQRTLFAVMPELGIRGGLQLTPCVRAFAGYDVIYLSSVARAGDAVNLTALPATSTAAPSPIIPTTHGSAFWMQGVSLGVELRF